MPRVTDLRIRPSGHDVHLSAFFAVPVMAAPPTPSPDDEIDALIAPVTTGDEAAWQALWQRLEPRLARLLAQPTFLGLRDRDDERRAIALEVMTRLRADKYRRLGQFLEARRGTPGLRFMTWLRVVTKRVGIDYLRGHSDYIDRRRDADASANGAWVGIDPLPAASELPGERPPVTAINTARQLLAYADGALTALQRRALELWTQGDSHDEIAQATDLADGAEAAKVVRAAIERLRRQFRGGDR